MNLLVKGIISFSTVTLLSLLIVGGSVNAETDYVDDCLENPTACEEPALTPSDQTDNRESVLLDQETESSSLFFEIIKVFFALLLVLALIYIFLYFLKRRNKLGNRIQSLENIGGISIGQNKSIQIIRLGNQVYVIGVGEDITLLKEIEDEALINKLLLEMEEERTEFNTDMILSFIQRKNDRKKQGEKADFKHLFNEELNSLQKNRKNILNRHKEDQNE